MPSSSSSTSSSTELQQFYFLCLLLSLFPFHVNSQPEITSVDRDILLNLKQQWANLSDLSSWNSSSSPCDWPEILCNDGGAVTGLLLSDKNITEPLPSSICSLRNLTFLDLSYNYIPGEFPRSLYNCSELQYLDLSQNYFVGPIPADINRISSKLRYISLGANNFSGDIPSTIGLLLELRVLHLYKNEFNGTFPPDIGNLTNLENLTMAYNGKLLPAGIPPEFGRLNKLKQLWMTQMNLVGEIPETFENLSSLVLLDLSRNNLNGEIPHGLLCQKNLSYLYLYRNRLSGQIPTKIEAINLIEIDMSMNNLTGSIPEDLANLQKLELLHLFSNKLSGEIPPVIALIPSLKKLRLFQNNFNGTLPPELGLHSQLEALEVSENNFTGNLPENLCKSETLAGVVAFSNKLSGEVPESLGNCPSLRTVQLYGNNFSGEVPQSVWTSKSLYSLMLSENSLSGRLPENVGINLSRLEISNNLFSGEIPSDISTWSNLSVLEASNNRFSGKIPEQLTNLSHLITLSLDGNSFSGEIPSKIISWKSLTSLNLSRNNLSGQIPSVLSSLPDLLVLDLSENQISGRIPPELANLKLTTLNLSSNHLSGKIPNEFDNLAYENSFLNNPKLCSTNLHTCSSKTRHTNHLSSKILALVLALSTTLLLLTIFSTIRLIRIHKKKKFQRDLGLWKLTSFQRLDFTKANIVSHLTEPNLIGTGGSGKVYRVQIGCPRNYVAVKRIWTGKNLDQQLEKEFLAEVEVLSKIRHSNILKLMCCISREESKLLVYEFMENRSLDQWLHRKKKGLLLNDDLDWKKRMKIIMGAAQGLCYLHHDCGVPIIHRDIKCSNILLDADFNARIADFGLAKILAKAGEDDTVSSIAGSVGYIAPELAYTTKVNEKIDIYGFGVVLLELSTGKEASHGDENLNLVEWAWNKQSKGKPVEEILDESVKKQYHIKEMTTVFSLGLACTSTLPSSRPSMKEVLQVLHRSSGPNRDTAKVERDVSPLLTNLPI